MNVDELRALNPFPGLRSFSPDEADMFFGREEQVDDLLRAVDTNAFVAVAGSSGCGKSSIVLAGLFKALTQRALADGGAAFRSVVLQPGGQPIARLAEPLAHAIGQGDSPEAIGALYGRLRLSAIGLVDAVRLAALPQGERVIVVVDQFEEIFRFERISDPEEAAAFVKLLLQASLEPSPSLRVVITLRSDALGFCADFPGLAEAVSRGLVLVPKLTRDQRKEAIVGPVQRRGYRIRPSLVQRILNDVPDDYDDLPVMQHALSRTWWHWAAHSPDASGGAGARDIEVNDYKKAIGDSQKALDEHGKLLLDTLPPKLKSVVAGVMRALTERRPDGTEVRRPLPFDELCRVVCRVAGSDEANVAAVVDHLRSLQACFLRPPPAEVLAKNLVIDITHESLIRQWTSLRDWVQAEAISRIELDKLLEAAQRHADGNGDLWKGRELKDALEWQRTEEPNEAWVRLCAGDAGAAQWPQAQKFIANSAAEVQAERRRRQIGRWGGVVFALVLIGALGTAAFSNLSAGEAKRRRLSQELASLGSQELRLDPALSAHLALAALDQDVDNPQAAKVLRQSVETLLVSHIEHIFELGAPIADARPNRSGTRIAVVGGDQLAIVEADDSHKVGSRQTLPWRAKNVWLLDERGLVVLESEGHGVRIQALEGKVLADWNCPGGKSDDVVFTVQASADGRWLAAGCRNGQLALWSLPDKAGPIGSPTVLTAGNGATVTAITFAKNGRWLASGDADGRVLLWNVADTRSPWIGKIKPDGIDSPITHSRAIRDLDLWENEREGFLATASDDGAAIVWQLDLKHRRLAKASGTEKVQWTLPHGRPVIRARIDTKGRLLTIADRRLQFWEGETAMPNDTHHNSWIIDADVSPSGELAVSSSEDGIARVWSRERDPIATLIGHRDAVTRSRFIGADRIITASSDGTMRIWRVAPVRTLHSSPGRWILTAAPSPDGNELAFCGEKGVVSGQYCGLLSLTDEESSATPIGLSIGPPAGDKADMVVQLLWRSDGSHVVATANRYDIYEGNTVPLEWDRSKPAVLAKQSGSAILAHGAQRSESVRTGLKGELTIQQQSGGDAAAVATFQVPGLLPSQAAALSADGRWVAATANKTIWIFDRRIPDGAPRRLQGHQGSVMALDFSPDSRYLASAGADRNAKIWQLDAAEGTPPVEMVGGHSAAIYKVVFNHRGNQIATGSADGTVRMWNARTGHELVTLEWHSAAVNDVRFHPTEDVIFTASDDGTVKRGSCRTCNLNVEQLRELVVGKGLGQLTQGGKEYLQRAGGRAKR